MTQTHHPTQQTLQIDPIWTHNGTMYACCAPGKRDQEKGVFRDLHQDMKCIQTHNIDCIICLIEDFEFDKVQITDYPERVAKAGIDFIHYPMIDHYIPTDLDSFHELVLLTCDLLHSGSQILIHCRGGVGRTGVLCACVLIHYGFSADGAILKVRQNRLGALKNAVQVVFIREYCKLLD